MTPGMEGEGTVVELVPPSGRELPLEGLYLEHDLRSRRGGAQRVFFYANFITSLDGRIAVPRSEGGGLTVPKQTANARDWRLFQELASQADLILSTGRYLREVADGKAQEILQTLEDPRFADLADWRAGRGLQPFPDLAILSASLDFSIPESIRRKGRRVLVVTTEDADPEAVRELEGQASEVIRAGDTGVRGRLLAAALDGRGYRTVYSAAGPKVHHLLLEDDVLDRLYLTFAPRLLGGDPFAAVVDGALLKPAVDMRLDRLYFDPLGLEGLGQLFACFDRAKQVA